MMGPGNEDMNYLLKRLFTLYVFLVKLVFKSIFIRLPEVPNYRVKRFMKALSKGPIAHRGGTPENTTEGFQFAKKVGATVVEGDLSFTQDGFPVFFHDDTVDRTSDGTGWLNKMDIMEVKKLDVGMKYGVPGIHVPSLREVIAFIKQQELFLLLDLKGTPKETVPVVRDLFKDDPTLYDQVAAISFYPDVIHALRVADPQILCGISCYSKEFSYHSDGRAMFPQWWKQSLAAVASRLFHWLVVNWVWKVLRIVILLPNKTDILSEKFKPDYYIKRDVSVVVWTINTQEERNYFEKVLDIPFLTDNVREMYQ